MYLGTDRDDDRADPGQDEKDAGCPGDAGAQAPRGRGRRGRVPGLRPRDDHAEPGYTPPSRIPQCRRAFLFAGPLL